MAGLRLAQADISSGLLDRDQVATIVASANEVVLDLEWRGCASEWRARSSRCRNGSRALAVSAETEVPPLPVLGPEDLRSEWGDGTPIHLYRLGASDLDEIVVAYPRTGSRQTWPARAGTPTEQPCAAPICFVWICPARAGFVCRSWIRPARHMSAMRSKNFDVRRRAPKLSSAHGTQTVMKPSTRRMRRTRPSIAVLRTLHEAVDAALARRDRERRSAILLPQCPKAKAMLRSAS